MEDEADGSPSGEVSHRGGRGLQRAFHQGLHLDPFASPEARQRSDRFPRQNSISHSFQQALGGPHAACLIRWVGPRANMAPVPRTDIVGQEAGRHPHPHTAIRGGR